MVLGSKVGKSEKLVSARRRSDDIAARKNDLARTHRTERRRPLARGEPEEVVGSMPPDEYAGWKNTFRDAFRGRRAASECGGSASELKQTFSKASPMKSPFYRSAHVSKNIVAKAPKKTSSCVPVYNARDKPPPFFPRVGKSIIPPLTTLPMSASLARQSAVTGMHRYGPLTKMAGPRPGRPSKAMNMPEDSGVAAVIKGDAWRSRAPSPSPVPEPVNSQHIRHDRLWQDEDELIVVNCNDVVFSIQRGRLITSSLFADLLSQAICAVTPEGRRLVNITEYHKDAGGLALIQEALDCELSPFYFKRCSQQDLRSLARASHALKFGAVFEATFHALSAIYLANAMAIAKASMRMPIDEAIETVECALRCGTHILNNIYKRAMFEIFTASRDDFCVHRSELARVVGAQGADEMSKRRDVGLGVLREYCAARWGVWRLAPPEEYPSVCKHAPDSLVATDAQKLEKTIRWFKAVREIDLSFEDEDQDCSNDVLRAMQIMRSQEAVRPLGWKECPGDQCRVAIEAAWNRRVEREWVGFKQVLEDYFPFSFVAEQMELDA